MVSDETLLDNVPEFISFGGGMLKATPSEEDGQRMLYFEASNQDVDHQNEMILQTALQESAAFYLRHGNIDLSHFTILGPKSGVPNFMEYEIGKPIDVQVNGTRTYVKAQLYQGESPMARNANMVWDSLTKQIPPSRWYPSVGGAVLAKSVKIDPKTRAKVAVIEKVRWNNVALDRCPVNKTVPEVSTLPVGIFAKSLQGFVMKTLEAGYGTDAVQLTGGGAMRRQSLHGAPINYWDFRDQVAKAASQLMKKPNSARSLPNHLTDYACRQFGLSRDEASEWTERFLDDLQAGMHKRKTQ